MSSQNADFKYKNFMDDDETLSGRASGSNHIIEEKTIRTKRVNEKIEINETYTKRVDEKTSLNLPCATKLAQNSEKSVVCPEYHKIIKLLQTTPISNDNSEGSTFIKTFYYDTEHGYSIEYEPPAQTNVYIDEDHDIIESLGNKLSDNRNTFVYEVATNFNITSNSPNIVLVGPQCSGKSSVVNRLIKADISPSSLGETTKGQILYTTKWAESNKIYVNNEEMENNDKAKLKIQGIMEKKNMEEHIKVIIEGPDYGDMFIVDTKGFQYDNVEDRGCIEKLVKSLENTNPKVLIVLESAQDNAGNQGITLSDNFPDYDRFIINKCDIHFKTWKQDDRALRNFAKKEKSWLTIARSMDGKLLTDEEEAYEFRKSGINWEGYKTSLQGLRKYIEKIYNTNFENYCKDVLDYLKKMKKKLENEIYYHQELTIDDLMTNEQTYLNDKIKEICSLLETGGSSGLSKTNIRDDTNRMLTKIMTLPISITDKDAHSLILNINSYGMACTDDSSIEIASRSIRKASNEYHSIMEVVYNKMCSIFTKVGLDEHNYMHNAIRKFVLVMLSEMQKYWIEECQIASRTLYIDRTLKLFQTATVMHNSLDISKEKELEGLCMLEKVVNGIEEKHEYVPISNIAAAKSATKYNPEIEFVKALAFEIKKAEISLVCDTFRRRLDDILSFYFAEKNSGTFGIIVQMYINGAENIGDIRQKYLAEKNKLRNPIVRKIELIDKIVKKIEGRTSV
jgi:hypothetical protein